MPQPDANSPHANTLRVNWEAAVRRGPGDIPTVSASFVASCGSAVRVLDLRASDDITGPVGHIPGCFRLDAADAAEAVRWLGEEEPVVLVSDDGEEAGTVARYMESLGMRYVAAMQGGMQAWRTHGYVTRHDRSALDRRLGADSATHANDPPGQGKLSLDAVRAHLGETGTVRWIRLAAFLTHGKRSCVDGRDDQCVVGTPGGDAGEFVLALAALERETGSQVPDDALKGLLHEWVDAFGRFYMHTDDHALEHLIDALREHPTSGPAVAGLDQRSDWLRFLARPPESVRETVLDLLVDPNNVGCGHLKLILLHPDAYGVRAGLVQAFMRAWFTMRWQGASDLDYVVLAGGHAEGAVVQVTIAEELWALAPIPMVTPFDQRTQVFVNHPQVVDFLREQTAHFLARVGPKAGLDVPEHSALLDAMRGLAGQQMGETLTRLASGLPVYEACFSPEGVSVSSAGAVG